MKLLYCDSCGDVFNLQLTIKTCSCGRVKGKYVDNTYAEVNGEGHSLAIGNGSLMSAIVSSMSNDQKDFRGPGVDPYAKHATSIICWARHHQGPANSHTRINKEVS